MSSVPIVSIIVPVYKVEKFLPKCLDSLINQTLEEIEIICVNDGSPDDCASILAEYQVKDSRVVVIEQENKGLSQARNTGLKHVNGKYTMFVDSDDWIDLDTCEKAVNAAEEQEADLVFWSYVREYGDNSKEKYLFWEDGTIFEEQDVKKQLHRRLCGLIGSELAHPDYANAIETAWGKLYLSTTILDNDILFVDTKEIGTEDALFNLYTLGYINRAIYLKKCFNHYRKTNSDSLTVTYKKDLFKQWQNLFDRMEKYINDNKLSNDYSIALNNRIGLSLVGLGLNIVSSNLAILCKVKEITKIISSKRYQNAYKTMEYSYLPFHWKLFLYCAKYRISFGVYCLLVVISKIIGM